MSFIAFQSEAYANNLSPSDMAPPSIETGTYIQRSCFRNIMSFLAPYRGPKLVRRPYVGTEIKQESHAYLQILRSDGTAIPVFNSIGDIAKEARQFGQYYTDFILQQVQESRAEKAQIVETFGETFFFFFGERPRTITARGILMNTHDFNWRTEFWQNYDLYLRGTQCVAQRARAYLSWDDILVEGFILNAQASESSDMPDAVTFAFTMVVTDATLLGVQLWGLWDQARQAANQYGQIQQTFEHTGSLESIVESLTTGRAILISQSFKEWLLENPEEILAMLDERISTAVNFAKDPWGETKKFVSSPTRALQTISKYTPEGFIPNEVCQAAVIAEDIIDLASDPGNAWIKLLGTAAPFVEAGLDAILPTPEGIQSLFGENGPGWDCHTCEQYGTATSTPTHIGD